eukprot:355036-Chlamydomonas_euryale.AAC.1
MTWSILAKHNVMHNCRRCVATRPFDAAFGVQTRLCVLRGARARRDAAMRWRTSLQAGAAGGRCNALPIGRPTMVGQAAACSRTAVRLVHQRREGEGGPGAPADGVGGVTLQLLHGDALRRRPMGNAGRSSRRALRGPEGQQLRR